MTIQVLRCSDEMMEGVVKKVAKLGEGKWKVSEDWVVRGMDAITFRMR